jgi:hypothetical protein
VNSWRRLSYVFDRGEILGLRVATLVRAALLLGALVAVLRRPGPAWILAALLVAVAILIWVLVARVRRRNFIRFVEEPLLFPPAHLLGPAEKIPLYATGVLGVEGKQRLFAELPGFYRTFATREHALLCQAQPRRWGGIVAWPEQELGLWYAFFLPDQIAELRTGRLQGSRDGEAALAVAYRQGRAAQGSSRRSATSKQNPKSGTPVIATIYLTFPTAADRLTVLADLLVDLPPTAYPKRLPEENAA